MELRVSANENDTAAIEIILDELEEEFEDVSIEAETEASEKRLFPGLENPVVQKIIIIASYKAAQRVYVELKERVKRLDAEVHLSAADIERLKWDLMESETGLGQDKLEVVDTHTPEEAGGMWLYEFIDEEGNRHQLEIYTEDLSFEHKEIK